MIRLSDTRNLTQEQADALMAEIRRISCDREVIIAKYEQKIANITAQAQESTADYDRELERLAAKLSTYIMAHRDRFQKPRNRVTPDGKYGLQTSKRLIVDDEARLIETLCDLGHHDCLKRVEHKLVRPAIIKHIEAGEQLPGAAVAVGEIAHCKVKKELIEEARNAAVDH